MNNIEKGAKNINEMLEGGGGQIGQKSGLSLEVLWYSSIILHPSYIIHG